MSTFSIFVNTTDKFEDCWEPFFKLFSIYWPDYKGKIYLNTETKTYQYPGLDIVSIRNCAATQDADKATWSECLIRGWNAVDNDVILYMQEDYFFYAPVNNAQVERYAAFIRQEDISCLHLTYASGNGPFFPSKYPGLQEIGPNAHCRLSCQGALWKKTALLKYARPHESAWQFEAFGTQRAHIIKDNFLNVDVAADEKNRLLPYILTGIIQGRWKKDVPELFAKHQISADFSRRGFYDYQKPDVLNRIKMRIKKFPKELPSIIDLWKLKRTLTKAN